MLTEVSTIQLFLLLLRSTGLYATVPGVFMKPKISLMFSLCLFSFTGMGYELGRVLLMEDYQVDLPWLFALGFTFVAAVHQAHRLYQLVDVQG